MYYLAAFEILYESVFCIKNLKFFNEEESRLLGSYRLLSRDGRRLLIRSYLRTRKMIRLSKLEYKEISSVKEAFEELKKHMWIVGTPCDTW